MKREILYNKDDEQISPVIYSDTIEDKGLPGGVATLDQNGKVPDEQISFDQDMLIQWVDF